MQAVATMAKTFDDHRHDFPDDPTGWQINNIITISTGNRAAY